MLENIYSSKISSDKKVREQNFLVNQIEYLFPLLKGGLCVEQILQKKRVDVRVFVRVFVCPCVRVFVRSCS
jgi:hypothetical protein